MTSSTLHIPAQLNNLDDIRHFVEETAGGLGAEVSATEDLILAVDEAATNVIMYGYGGGPGELEIEIKKDEDALVAILRDRAPSFDPTGVPAPDITIPLEDRFFGGMGIHLMRASTDAIHYRARTRGGNELTLVKRAFKTKP